MAPGTEDVQWQSQEDPIGALAGIPVAVLVAGLAALPARGQDVPPDPEEEVEVTTATADDVALLVEVHAQAKGDKDGARLAQVLAQMSGHDNPEFKPLALDAIRYRASPVDKRAAKDLAEELGTTSRKDVERLVLEREARVQSAAAHVLANHPGDRAVLKVLERAFGDKRLRRDKPTVVAALIFAFGRLRHDEVEEEVVRELSRSSTREVTRASVRYLGQLPTKSFDHVRQLCELLEPPQPASVDHPDNPPAGFWAGAWETWSWTRRDVTWSLKQITGQVFRPAEGDHPSDYQAAIAYIEEHRERLGLD